MHLSFSPELITFISDTDHLVLSTQLVFSCGLTPMESGQSQWSLLNKYVPNLDLLFTYRR